MKAFLQTAKKWLPFLVLCLLLSDLKGYAQKLPDSSLVFIIDSSLYRNELDTELVKLTANLYYLPVSGEELSISQVSSKAFLDRFHPYSESFPEPDESEIYWLALEIRNDMQEKAELCLNVPSLACRIYAFEHGQQTAFYSSGFDLPISQWSAFQSLYPVFDAFTVPFEISPETSTTFFLELGPGFLKGFLDPEFSIFTQRSYYAYDAPYYRRQMQRQAAYQGMLVMILLFSLLMFVNNRDQAYLYYSLYVACIAYYFLIRFGYDRLWLWGQELAGHPIGQNLAVYGIGVFYPLFTIFFLHRNGWRPRLRRLLQYLVYLSLFGAAVSSLILLIIAPTIPEGNTLINALFIPTGFYGIGVFFYTNYFYLRSGNQQARYFALAGFTLLIGIVPIFFQSILLVFELIEPLHLDFINELPFEKIFQFACLVQILMFALALSFRSRLIEKERTALQEMENTKARFFANISHEFKTPLTLILGPANDLIKKTEDEPSRQLLELIRNNARRLLKLINEILNLSKMDAGKMPLHIQKGDIIGFTRKLVQQFQSYGESKNLQLEFSSKSNILTLGFDRDKIEKVLTNLLSNACKFTPEGGKVSVAVSTENRSDQPWVSIQITDTGIGIDENHLRHLFDRFYQAEQTDYTTDQPSTGIGLALTKELIKLHQGEIKVQSRLGKGTRFTILLPADLPEATGGEGEKENLIHPADMLLEPPAAGREEKQAIAEEVPEILLVEDNPELRSYIRSCLEPQYQILEAENGLTGLEMATRTIPHLVIMDVMMPEMDGFTLSRKLKQDEKTDHIPIIILTGKSSRSSKLEGLETAADVYLSKPFDADELRLHIRNLLDNRRRMQEHYSRRILLEATQMEITSREEEFLQKAIAAVEQHLNDEDFSVEKFSEILLMDRTQLFRKLRALTDQNPSTFIRNIRLKRAKRMLEGDAGTVAEIAFAVGFRSTTYFIKCFREVYGESPGKMKPHT